jgi:hypothetical protein
MTYRFQLQKLQEAETNCLEKLRCLEMKLKSESVDNRSRILEHIYVAVEEIAQANRLIRDHKASYLQDLGSLPFSHIAR